MKKIFSKILKSIFIGVISVFLVTIGIDAADHNDNFSESIIGRLVSGEQKGPCNDGMVFISTDRGGFCMDKYEMSPGDDCPYLQISNQNDTSINLNNGKCKPVSVAGVFPWRYISQSQAAAACAKAGKRLPTGEEWYLASLGTPDHGSDWSGDDCQVDSNWEAQPGKTGSGENCISGAGAYDMVGNVWEWVKEEVNDGVYSGKKMPESGYVKSVGVDGLVLETSNEEADLNYNNDYFWIKEKGVRGMARGGYWDNKEDAGLYSLYLVSPPSFAGTGVGFRCVSDPIK